MTLNREKKLVAIQTEMDAKQAIIKEVDRKIGRTKRLIEKTRGINLSTEALENQLAVYLHSREDMRAEWQGMADKMKGWLS